MSESVPLIITDVLCIVSVSDSARPRCGHPLPHVYESEEYYRRWSLCPTSWLSSLIFGGMGRTVCFIDHCGLPVVFRYLRDGRTVQAIDLSWFPSNMVTPRPQNFRGRILPNWIHNLPSPFGRPLSHYRAPATFLSHRTRGPLLRNPQSWVPPSQARKLPDGPVSEVGASSRLHVRDRVLELRPRNHRGRCVRVGHGRRPSTPWFNCTMLHQMRGVDHALLPSIKEG